MFGTGITALYGKSMVGQTITGLNRLPLFHLHSAPFIGPVFNQDIVVYLSGFLLIIIHLFLYRTTAGLNLRTVGENPYAADNAGVNVNLYRFLTVLTGSFIVGIGGAYLSLAYTPLWIENMSAGRGWIAVALVSIFFMGREKGNYWCIFFRGYFRKSTKTSGNWYKYFCANTSDASLHFYHYCSYSGFFKR